MSYYQFRLQAGVPFRVNVSGKLILVDDVDGAAGVDITPIRGGSNQRTMPKRKKAFKFWIDYDAIELQADAACTVSMFLSFTDVSLGFADGALVNVAGGVSVLNGPDSRVPVDVAGGVVNVTADNVGVSNTDANPVPVKLQAFANLVHLPAVAVNTGAAQAVVADATLKRLRLRNESSTARIAVGGAGVTMANAAIILEPGDTFIESDAAGASWFAVSDTNGASLRVMGVK